MVDPNEPTFERVAKPVSPTERELAANPRARSARLRSAVRTSAPARKETSAMSARSFRSLIMVASCAGAALGCYLVSLRVASERAALEDVETRIVLAQRDLRVLQTEIGTRGRLSQLERWNAGAFALVGAGGRPVPARRLRARPADPAPAQGRFPGAGGACFGARARTARSRRSARPSTDDAARRPSVAPERAASPGKLEDRDARGPGKAGRRLPLAAGTKSTDRPVTAAKPAPKQVRG